MRFSFTKRDSWVTNGTLALHFTYTKYTHVITHVIKSIFFVRYIVFFVQTSYNKYK